MPTPPTAGELIRALLPFYDGNTYYMNVGVNNYRRERGSKNWYAAALALLESFQEAESEDDRDTYEEAEYYAELERGYAQDRI